MLRYLPFILILAVWIYAFIDCLNTPEKEVRKLPKVAWVIIILLFGQVLLGPIVWFAVGRPRRNAPYGATKPQERRWVAPDDNPEFLKSLGGDRPTTNDAEPSSPDTDEDRDKAAEPPRGGTPEAGGGVTDPGAPTEPGVSQQPGGDPEKATGGTGKDEAEDLQNWEEELRAHEDEVHRRDKGGSGPDDTPPST